MRQALYRLYRPKSFDEVVGQEHITTVLKNEMREGNLSHAYLFIGSRGTGKTTCAKLVAKAVNCLDLKDGSPCGECEICKGADDGSLLDIVEIDAASNNGVDNIRDLRDEAFFTPAVAKYRVYIIDEVHMLSTSAFNALLKILEEPPEHVIFILATTEVHKVLPTIISRCQRFDFRRIESPVIAARLLEVARREGFGLADDAAALIARLSDGGMRDALSLLDVCVANGGDVTLDTVTAAAGLIGSGHLLALCGRIIDGDTAAVLGQLSELSDKGMEPQRLCEQLCGHYRNLMLVKTIDRPEDMLGCLPSETDALRAQAEGLTLNDILHSITALQDASYRMGRSASKRSELELVLVTLCEPGARTGYSALLERIERLESTVRKLSSGAPAAAAAQPQQEQRMQPARPDTALEPPKPAQSDEIPLPDAPPEYPPEPARAPVPQKAAPDITLQPPAAAKPAPAKLPAKAEPFSQWARVLDCLGRINKPNALMLSGTKAYFNGKQVLIDVSNPVILDMLRNNEYMKSNIKQAIYEAMGERYGLGPYRAPADEQQKEDPLEKLVSSLPKSPDIIIE